MAEVRSAAMMVPLDLRSAYLERLAIELRGKDLGGTDLFTGPPMPSPAQSSGMLDVWRWKVEV